MPRPCRTPPLYRSPELKIALFTGDQPFEGAAFMLDEALTSDCALIQSRNYAPAVTPESGIMLDEISTDEVQTAMLREIEDRDQLDAWRANAQAEAQNYTFARHRDHIAALLKELAN